MYQYKDHLGNVRLTYAKNTATQVLEIIEENNYYPFGLKHQGYVTIQESDNKYKYNGKELQDELGLNMYDYGARNYDPALGRWMNIDPLAIVYHDKSPYNYSLNNPIYFKDPDGKRVVANGQETQNTILAYITEQLGENNGFYFNKKGELSYKNGAVKKASKGFNDEQKDIMSGLKEIADNQDKTIEVVMNENSDEFTVDVYEPGFVKDENGVFVMENGVPTREGWQKTNLQADLNTQNTGGALFWAPGKFDKTKQGYGYIAINKQTASTIQIQGEGGKLTTPSASSVFIHESLDHGLDFVRNGNVNISGGAGVENVKFHNQALKNISKGQSPLRTSHYDTH